MSRPYATRPIRWASSLLMFASLCHAQQGQGTILGTVTDATQAVVPGATVTITNTGTNAKFATKTNGVGFYTAPDLPVGQYVVTAEIEGFKKVVRSGITLQVDQRAQIDFRLEPGRMLELVEVTGSAPMLDTSSATLGKVVENRSISALPLNGRNALALVLLTPGVKSQAGPTNGGFVDRGISLSAVSINGGPSAINNFMIDGATDNQSYLGDINVNPTVDAIQEFKVESGTMSAQFGFTAGGVVNIVTKSGTNKLRGTLYEFLRNDALDARQAFVRVKAPLRYNQFGGALGGPIYLPRLYDGRDRSFFFFNYEAWRFKTSVSPIISVPTLQQRQGDFSDLRDVKGKLIPIYDPATTRRNPSGSGFIRDPFPGNVIPRDRLDKVAVNYLQFYPLPNRPPSNLFSNSNNFIASNPLARTMEQYTVRIDHRLSNKHSLSGRYINVDFFNDNGQFSPYPNPNARLRLDNLHTKNLSLSDTYTLTPGLLNQFRVSLARQFFPFQAFSFGQNWPERLGLPPSVPPFTLPRVNNGLPDFGAFTVGLRGSTTWQFSDSLTWVRSNHTVKFGTEIFIQQANNFQREVPSGQFIFPGGLTANPQAPAGTGSGFATFLLGTVGSASATTFAGESEQGYSTSFFIQDDWRATSNLTLNLGLRYDFQPWPSERHNGLSNFNPFAVNTEIGLLGREEYAGVGFGRHVLQNVYDNWGPRFGFAYKLFGRGKSVLRGGYSILYPSIFYRDFFGSTAGFASTNTTYQPPGGSGNFPAFQFKDGFPSPPTPPLGAKLGPSAFLGGSVSLDEANGRVPMSQQWNLALQHQVGGWLVEATYTGNHVTHLASGGYDFNQLDPQFQRLGLALQNPVPNPLVGRVPGGLGAATITRAQSLRPYPYYTFVGVRNPHQGYSIYHAFLFSVERRLSKDLTLLVSYTGAKLISDSVVSPINFGVDGSVGVVGYQNGKFNRRGERSIDPTDVSQRLVISGVYNLPFGSNKKWKSSSGFANSVIGGWQVNSIAILQTGTPLVIRGANNFLADRPNSTGRSARLNNPTAARWFDTTAFINPPNFTYGNLGRTLPDVRMPGVVNIDLSVFKDIRLREAMSLQFRAEAFNFLNHVNLGSPSTGFSPGSDGMNRNANFGVINSARDPRVLQFALKLFF